MKLFTNSEIAQIEQQTLAEEGITPIEMVTRVAESVAYEFMSIYKPERPVVVFAGPDTCGAYALEASRALAHAGYNPEIILFNIGGNRLNQECSVMRGRLIDDEDASCDFIEVTGLQFTMPELTRNTLVIDGLFGSNFTGTLSGGYKYLVRSINESGAEIVSIDIPSGLSGDSTAGVIRNDVIHAHLTLAIGVPRISFFMSENGEVVGRWKVVDVGYSRKAMRAIRESFFLVEGSDVRRLLPKRQLYASKADFGHAIIFAGSYGMMGAAVLATRGALRAGAGKVTCHSPRCGYFVMQTSVPCAMFDCDPGDAAIRNIELDRSYEAVALGPGMGTADFTIDALEGFLKVANANSRPLILDADALNCIARRPSLLSYLPVLSILTPHAAEFDRLFGVHHSPEARLMKAIEVAEFHKIIIILKGHHTTIVRPDGKICINSSGTPALATAGTGDVLTGVLAGLIAQGIKPELAALAGVYIHGKAGEIAQSKHGTYGVTAEDVADSIGMAIKKLTDN